MALRPSSDLTAADWITSSDLPWDQLVGFGPEGFPAYARLRFIPDPAHPGQSENDVGFAAPDQTDLLRTALEILARHTGTPEDCYFCLWDGWGTPSVLEGPRVVVPNRAYFLFRGSLADFGDWGAADVLPGQPRTRLPDPAFVWPADHAWCVANDVDPHWAGIGAGFPAMEELLADPRLDVVLVDPHAEQPFYR